MLLPLYFQVAKDVGNVAVKICCSFRAVMVLRLEAIAVFPQR